MPGKHPKVQCPSPRPQWLLRQGAPRRPPHSLGGHGEPGTQATMSTHKAVIWSHLPCERAAPPLTWDPTCSQSPSLTPRATVGTPFQGDCDWSWKQASERPTVWPWGFHGGGGGGAGREPGSQGAMQGTCLLSHSSRLGTRSTNPEPSSQAVRGLQEGLRSVGEERVAQTRTSTWQS